MKINTDTPSPELTLNDVPCGSIFIHKPSQHLCVKTDEDEYLVLAAADGFILADPINCGDEGYAPEDVDVSRIFLEDYIQEITLGYSAAK